MLTTKTRIAVAVTNKVEVSANEMRASAFSEASPSAEVDAILDARLGLGRNEESKGIGGIRTGFFMVRRVHLFA
jgi:hypothetical protein